MSDHDSEAFSDILNDDNLEYLQKNIELESLNMHFEGSEHMDPMMLNMNLINSENTLIMEDYKIFGNSGFVQYPPEEPTDLSNNDYSGLFGFEVFVDPNGLKSPWEYSAKCNKIYIDIKHKFPINFSINTRAGNENLFVRATPMFEEDSHCQALVYRCICHEQPRDPLNEGISQPVIQHIMRCFNTSAKYCGDKTIGKRLSIVIPLTEPNPGVDSVKEYFQFVCKNSCVGGMNRRPIQVVFTLENNIGQVLGRRVLRVRICSCPKRDKDKDEQKTEKHTNPSGKKRKMEKKVSNSHSHHATSTTTDTKLYSLTLNVAGEENFKRLMKCCEGLMAAEILKLEGKNVSDAPFRKCLNEVTALMNKTTE